MASAEGITQFDIGEILRLLPHRYPMLLVDRVLDCKPYDYLTAIKNVSYNEPFFNGHFPGHPVMPGVLILEALAQATGLLAFHSLNECARDGTVYYLVGVDKARFKRPVRPGDQLHMHVKLERQIRGIYRFSAVGRVDDTVVTTADFMTTKTDARAD
ncbi:MAG: 3-hydroxyacyl-ACP dehydratase FabZ [Gammaproteobacteria bacterium]